MILVRFVFCLGLLSLAVACEKEQPVIPPPPDLMEEELYMQVFLEMEFLKVYQSQRPGYDVIDSLYDEILIKYDIDGEHFVESHRYYQSQIEEQQARIDTILARLERRLQMISEAEKKARQAGSPDNR